MCLWEEGEREREREFCSFVSVAFLLLLLLFVGKKAVFCSYRILMRTGFMDSDSMHTPFFHNCAHLISGAPDDPSEWTTPGGGGRPLNQTGLLLFYIHPN